MRSGNAVLLLSFLVVIGCADGGSEVAETPEQPVEQKWYGITESELGPVEQGQFERAVAAQQVMAKTLMAELTSEFETGGPEGAVVVCRDLAPMIADHVSSEHGVTIGRTSHRLRNPENRAPAWAEDVVADGLDGTFFFKGPGGELGVMRPIMVAAPCLGCHGATESLRPAVIEALNESYPDDTAVGFGEGDLRGWFWIEVPAVS